MCKQHKEGERSVYFADFAEGWKNDDQGIVR
jgi:hypothetical protein